MGKKSRRKGQVKAAKMPYVARTFEGLPAEGDWIALREFVPSATATTTLSDGTPLRVVSLLPGTGAGLKRPDGEIWVGLQVIHNFGDISRDLAHVVELARELEPGNPVVMTDPGVGPRLQDLLDPTAGFDVTVHEGFDFWLTDTDTSAAAQEALQMANESVAPTVRVDGVDSAYRTDMGTHSYLRWVMPQDEEKLLDAFSRLQAAGDELLGEGTELIGSFRAHGRLVPVWDVEVDAEALAAPAKAFEKRLADALAVSTELTSEERRARRELSSRQVTIR